VTDRAEQEGVPLCPGCFAENDPDADFCRQCGRPMSAMATVDPLRRVQSHGYWWRGAVHGKVRPIIFWGTWLSMGPALLISVAAAIWMVHGLSEGTARGSLSDFLQLFLFVGLAIVLCVLLGTMTRNYLAKTADAEDEET